MIDIILFGNSFQQNRGSLIIIHICKGFFGFNSWGIWVSTNYSYITFTFKKTPHTWAFPCLILCYNVMEVLLWRMPNNVSLCPWPGCSIVNACIVHRQWLQETQPSEKIKLLKTDMEPQNRHEYLLLQCFMFFQFRIKMHMWTTITGGIGLSSWTAEIMELNLCTTLPCFKRTRMICIQHIFTCWKTFHFGDLCTFTILG